MIIKTKHKILLARLIQTPIIILRKAIGLSTRIKANRASICWHLDLHEGIDFAIYLTGRFEPETVTTMASLIKSGDVVLDIGANIGAHTLSMARMVGKEGKVIAFEPTKYAFDKLVANTTLNPKFAVKDYTKPDHVNIQRKYTTEKRVLFKLAFGPQKTDASEASWKNADDIWSQSSDIDRLCQ